MDRVSGTSPYPGFDKSGQYNTPRKAPRVRPEASEYAQRNAGSINLFNDEKNTHVIGPVPSPRCLSHEAKQNYQKNRNGQVSSVLCGSGSVPCSEQPPAARVKPEAQTIAEHHKGRSMGQLINNTGERHSARQVPRVKEEASHNADLDKGQRMSHLLHDPTAVACTPRPAPRVKPEAGETADLGAGSQMATVMFKYGTSPSTSRPPPRVKAEASANASLDQGKRMQNLFAQYGNQPQTARPAPRVRDGGEYAAMDQGGRLSRLMHEGDKLRGDAKPFPHAASADGRRITNKGKQSSLSQVFSETSKWQIVPTAGVRKAKAY